MCVYPKKNDDFLIIETVVFFFVQLIRIYLHVYVCVESQEETTTKKWKKILRWRKSHMRNLSFFPPTKKRKQKIREHTRTKFSFFHRPRMMYFYHKQRVRSVQQVWISLVSTEPNCHNRRFQSYGQSKKKKIKNRTFCKYICNPFIILNILFQAGGKENVIFFMNKKNIKNHYSK